MNGAAVFPTNTLQAYLFHSQIKSTSLLTVTSDTWSLRGVDDPTQAASSQ
ncbi:hypothetical protein QUB61_05680 [Microcoleus sp. C2D2]